jgi:hypothetical protein
MNRGRLGRLIVAAVIGATGLLVAAAPASAAEDHECLIEQEYTFITSAATGKYVSVYPSQGGLLRADQNVNGFYQQFFLCYKVGWAWPEWDFKAASTGKLVSADLSGSAQGIPKARNTNIGWSEYFRVDYLGTDAVGNYYSILQVASQKYLSAYSNGSLRFDSTFIGWNQAFRFSWPWIFFPPPTLSDTPAKV